METITQSLSEGNVIPDDVLIEILLLLPLFSLQLFKSISKHWLSLITSEYFTRRLRKPRIETPCGLFTRAPYSEYYDFVSLGPKVTSSPLCATITEAGSNFRIMESCNGLLLCRNYVSSVYYYYVYNPFTEIFKNIPFAREPYSTSMILAFDPTKSPYYKVIVTEKKGYLFWNWGEDREQYLEEEPEEDRDQDYYAEQFPIYSSETGKWRIYSPSSPADTFWYSEGKIYWNNAIHWLSYKTNLHCKLDIVDHPMVTNIQTPALDNVVHRHTRKLFESRGCLLLLMSELLINEGMFHYHIFEMSEEASKWLVKYIVYDASNFVPCERLCAPYVLCIALGERGYDSFMVTELDNKIVRYNFLSNTVSTLCNSVLSYHPETRVPFIASLAGV